MGILRKQASTTIQADTGPPHVRGKSPERGDRDKRRRRRQIGFRVLLGAVFLVVTVAPPLLWPSVTYAQTVSAAAALVGAIVAIQKADASADAAARAEAAQETAERASRAAHMGLAFQARPNVGVFWARPVEGFIEWDLHLTADRPAKDIEAEWHFADGRPPVRASFLEIIPDPSDPFDRPAPPLVVRLGVPASVKLMEIHKQVVRGTLEYTDAAGLARWKRTWRYLPPDPADPEAGFYTAPISAHESKLVGLLNMPDDL
jgi:hypothetical protein